MGVDLRAVGDDQDLGALGQAFQAQPSRPLPYVRQLHGRCRVEHLDR